MLTLSLSHRTQRNVGTYIFSCYICFSHYFPCLSAFHICHHFSLHLIWFFSFSKKYCFMPLLCNQVLLMKVPCHYVCRSFVPACANGYLDMNRNSQKTTLVSVWLYFVMRMPLDLLHLICCFLFVIKTVVAILKYV